MFTICSFPTFIATKASKKRPPPPPKLRVKSKKTRTKLDIPNPETEESDTDSLTSHGTQNISICKHIQLTIQ